MLLLAAREVRSRSLPAGARLETDTKNGAPELSLLLFWFCGSSWYQSRDFQESQFPLPAVAFC